MQQTPVTPSSTAVSSKSSAPTPSFSPLLSLPAPSSTAAAPTEASAKEIRSRNSQENVSIRKRAGDIVATLWPYRSVVSLNYEVVISGGYTWTTGSRETFVLLNEGLKFHQFPSKLVIASKGESAPAYITYVSGKVYTRSRIREHTPASKSERKEKARGPPWKQLLSRLPRCELSLDHQIQLLQRKRDEFNKDKNERIKNAKDPKSFWNAIASFRKKTNNTRKEKYDQPVTWDRAIEEAATVYSKRVANTAKNGEENIVQGNLLNDVISSDVTPFNDGGRPRDTGFSLFLETIFVFGNTRVDRLGVFIHLLNKHQTAHGIRYLPKFQPLIVDA
ncbi:hypothetical protein LAZ67_X004231 [Cordylochernes scorpioides]|uniref:Uncharacterized protein n=1 Tax=Cordylochernes scorpioides TaxID=51811 RepID=A0ABY6LXG6_9ARAC|nr:hypothetical protein LAZ67_X004231 [Cordylochernes scorpioides]